ncbi:transposon Ty3-G Gag-Pol polyprotein [Trichonephila clavipes]|nr:transposon Ty3-G Gag-Pol polyprotein [Trichonephila clavipes]
MQRRSESHNVTDSFLLELFLQQLPPNVQSILASIHPLTAQKASEVADRILEVAPVQVSAVSKYSSANSYDSSESKLLKELKLLRQDQTFIAANGTPIQVYGRKLMSLDLGLRRNFVFPFFYL